ncbi:hypothetical protein [Chromohalobacter moromii]|uniref:Phage tail protein n=1 Tax=Chromohalobacter moromii TaxID=2860329 RepID=A0A9X3B4N4_9GAMM|nr:hypothetical protein [Chromohalobacter moromii]MCT8506129.1 hypothetical protein [Chromohalobacter moromii]
MPTIPQEIAESTEKLTTNTDIVDKFVHGPATIYIPVRGGTLRPLLYWQGTFQDKVVELAGPYVQQAEDSAGTAQDAASTATEKAEDASGSATLAGERATAAGEAQTGAETARDKSQAWAEGEEPEEGKKSAKGWAGESSDSATLAGQRATAAGDAQTDAETARDKSKAWAEGTEPEAGKKSAREWAEEAQSLGDPNAFDITADQTTDSRRLDQWAAQAKANQQKLATAYRLGNGAFATDSGAADSYVLSVNYEDATPTAYNDGDQYRFRAGAANAGASTVNINGLGAKGLVTVTGVALPAGYIRTDAETTITYDAANDWFVAGREVERGWNSNGYFIRWADGSQKCKQVRQESLEVTSGPATGGFYYANIFWIYPAAFVEIPQIDLKTRHLPNITVNSLGGAGELFSYLSECTLFIASVESIPEATYLLLLEAQGDWY